MAATGILPPTLPKLIFKPEPDPEALRRFKDQLNIHPAFLKILLRLNVRHFEDARDFFRPHQDLLHDPFLMQDMGAATERILKALRRKEYILFWGDYDVDGTTATALMMSFFRDYLEYDRVDFYIPDRYSEGYGLSPQGLQYASDNRFTLLISLDCGIRAVEEIRLARSFDLDVIVCDHHLPGTELPPAHAILNPKQPGCPYPFKELSGCGIAFKLVQALATSQGLSVQDLLPLTDWVAISSCADIVPLIGENRTLVYLGLQEIKRRPRPAVQALAAACGLDLENLTSEDIVFGISPRINAAGRIEHGRLAVQMLLEENTDRISSLVQKLENLNEERRAYDRQMTIEAMEMVASGVPTQFSIVAFRDTWHKGVVGIVAARLVEKYHLPAVVLTQSNGIITGSARSIPGFDLYEALSSCAHLLLSFGGHAHAAGLTLLPQNLDAFIQRFDQVAAERFGFEKPTPFVIVDDEISFQHVTTSFVKIKNQLGPFGPGNMDPVFLSRNLIVHDDEIVEFGEGHLKFKVRQPSCCPTAYPAVGFGFAPYKDFLKQGLYFDMAYNLSLYGRQDRIELEAKAILPSNSLCP
ncbi:MAG: single-stranded-DNA-specific exonuclease RecJ [Flavobacteriales bacterium]|nr:single-stranded-DNA-specific exonuclease RecJ [Flavobacteriales bacterium]MDW8433078.1 single-stranded-DNA-specific exonuclease RecJ [Flavobacteriales bacterium]